MVFYKLIVKYTEYVKSYTHINNKKEYVNLFINLFITLNIEDPRDEKFA